MGRDTTKTYRVRARGKLIFDLVCDDMANPVVLLTFHVLDGPDGGLESIGDVMNGIVSMLSD
jgi:hypothetical protein